MLLCHGATPQKGFIWICAPDHIHWSWALLFLWAICSSTPGAVSMALGQGAAGNGHGASWCLLERRPFSPFPLLFTEGKLQNVPPKIFWCFSHKLQWLIDVTVFYCKSNSCTHYAAIRVLTNCWIFLSIHDCNDLQSWQYCKKEGKLKLEQI